MESAPNLLSSCSRVERDPRNNYNKTPAAQRRDDYPELRLEYVSALFIGTLETSAYNLPQLRLAKCRQRLRRSRAFPGEGPAVIPLVRAIASAWP
jgi:hypothetical protein